ncbi:ABC transporter permease [[Clostridium] fimetarium]|uniref:ABC-2 type transporter n=1 Tax=[Clostridium] fimetarium TaxID=99656 RepID=A0A1I0RNB4_9FIRM|nr:ABC transporter permease [[Clostridium] fimetarium]SEW42525.1 ABC-2 type transporter [[Clostridium] fimetarium]
MEIYLVMKNNLKRNLFKKSTYIIMFLLPIMIAVIGMITSGISQSSIRVGIIADEVVFRDVQARLDKYENIDYEPADVRTIHTDRIMNKYHFVLNYLDKSDSEGILNEIENLAASGLDKNANKLSQTQRMVSMLMTVYMIIAAVYATKIISDKNNGTFQRFAYSGNSRKKYAFGYVISTGLIVLVQITVAFVILKTFDKEFALTMFKSAEIIATITMITTVYGVTIAFRSKKDMNANICASSIAVIMSLLGGTFVSVSEMPSFLQILSIINPIRWIIWLV